MKTLIFFFGFFPMMTLAATPLDCTTGSFTVKMSHFLGSGAEFGKPKNFMRLGASPAAALEENPSEDRALYVGIFAFVRAVDGWNVYRKNGNTYQKFAPPAGSFRVFPDDNTIMVKREPNGVLTIRKHSTVSEQQTEVRVRLNSSLFRLETLDQKLLAEIRYNARGISDAPSEVSVSPLQPQAVSHNCHSERLAPDQGLPPNVPVPGRNDPGRR
jgi:hypothetical protein